MRDENKRCKDCQHFDFACGMCYRYPEKVERGPYSWCGEWLGCPTTSPKEEDDKNLKEQENVPQEATGRRVNDYVYEYDLECFATGCHFKCKMTSDEGFIVRHCPSCGTRLSSVIRFKIP